MPPELLEVVNEQGEVLGIAPRDEVHRKRLLHRVVHLLVVNSRGQLLLQKRSMTKDIAPGKWDTSVGGHIDVKESIEDALRREAREELHLEDIQSEFLYSFIHTDPAETELVHSFRCVRDGLPAYNRDEITEVRFWDMDEIERRLESGIFTDNFKDEFRRYMNLIRSTKR